MRLDGKVAIITGGAGGIGFASAERMAEEGAKIVIADVSPEDGDRAVKDLTARGYQAIFIKVDHTKVEDTELMAAETLKKFGQIDILVNIAGGSAGKFIRPKARPFAESTKEEWDRIVDVNLTGPRNATRAIVNHMISRKYGKIIFFSTVAALIGGNNTSDYSAAKAGLIGLTRQLACELSPQGINVNCIAPGIVGTPRIKAFAPEYQAKMVEGIKLGRMATPLELANVVLFLSSDESSYITGECIPVVGGKDLSTG